MKSMAERIADIINISNFEEAARITEYLTSERYPLRDRYTVGGIVSNHNNQPQIELKFYPYEPITRRSYVALCVSLIGVLPPTMAASAKFMGHVYAFGTPNESLVQKAIIRKP